MFKKFCKLKVIVVDRDYLVDWKLCMLYNDFYMIMFDGKIWENYRLGEFVMYRY